MKRPLSLICWEAQPNPQHSQRFGKGRQALSDSAWRRRIITLSHEVPPLGSVFNQPWGSAALRRRKKPSEKLFTLFGHPDRWNETSQPALTRVELVQDFPQSCEAFLRYVRFNPARRIPELRVWAPVVIRRDDVGTKRAFPMVCVLTLSSNVCAEVGMLFRGIWALRRRCCTGPLLLLGIAVGLFYHTVTMHRDRTEFKSSQRDQRNKSAVFDYKLLLKNPERLVSLLEASQTDSFVSMMLSLCLKAVYSLLFHCYLIIVLLLIIIIIIISSSSIYIYLWYLVFIILHN